MNRNRFLIIEGNIGSGKTSLAKYIAEHFNFSLILEEFAENTFLPQFYENPSLFAFPLEMSFMAARFTQLKEFFKKNTLPFPVVSDYMFAKTLLFAKSNLRREEFILFEQFFNLLKPTIPPPALIVYLHKEAATLKNNINKRGRSFEQQIEHSYLEKLNKAYQSYLNKNNKKLKILFIDTDALDFVNNKKHMQIILKKIENTGFVLK